MGSFSFPRFGILICTAALFGSPIAPAHAGPDCYAYLALSDPVTVGYLNVRIDYASSGSSIYMPGLSPQCSSLLAGTFATAAGYPQQLYATVSLATTPPGITGPVEFARCGFVLDAPGIEPTPDDLPVTVLEARTSSTFAMLDPLPVMEVSRVVCPAVVTTTTVSVTTTLSTTTTTTLPDLRDTCTLRLRLDAVVPIKTLNFDLYYTKAGGEFAGAGSAVECAGLVPGGLNGFLDLDPLRKVSFNIGHSSGYSGPIDLAVCSFERDAGTAGPTAADFSTYVLYASAPGGATITPAPPVIVSEVLCPPPYGTTTSTLGMPVTTSTTTSVTTSTTLPVAVLCGDANGDALLSATDGLFALRAAVGSTTCAACRCDADSSGSVSATDAQRILKRSTGQPVPMTCPPCS